MAITIRFGPKFHIGNRSQKSNIYLKGPIHAGFRRKEVYHSM